MWNEQCEGQNLAINLGYLKLVGLLKVVNLGYSKRATSNFLI